MSDRILRGHVSRVINGELVALKPGDPAPDWVTNPELITDAPTESEPSTTSTVADGGTAGDANANITPDLGTLKKPELQALAKQLGVATGGSKEDLVARIAAKRDTDAQSTPQDDPADPPASEDELRDRLRTAGIEPQPEWTEEELQAAVESLEE